jgi:glycosyltransferase involved in cell wall biosynthesis
MTAPASDRSLVVGFDAREGFRHNPRGIGLYARHMMREFGELCPDVRFRLYHERPVPADMPPIPANMMPVQASIPGGRFHSWERVLMPWRLRRDRVSLYHGTYNTLPPAAPLWARLLGKAPPMVVTIHDVIVTWFDDSLDDPYVRYCRQVTKRVVRDAAAILTVSEWSKNDICERFGVAPEKVRIFYNGVHPDFLAGPVEGAGEAMRRRFADGEEYVFAIGSGLDRKNTGGLIDAYGSWRTMRSRRPGASGDVPRLLVSGVSEAEQQRLGARAEAAGVGERVRFLPYLTREELIAVYAGASLFCYPSFAEGWGIPVVESLALGTPVAASDRTAIPEAGGSFAKYFDPADPRSIAATLDEAWESRDEFARSGARDQAAERARGFTWRRAAEVTLETYRNVAARS